MITAVLVVALAQAVLLAAICVRLRLPAGAPQLDATHDHELCELIVREAVKERIDHERERPERYPLDHRERSILQRAKRRMHFAKVQEPPPDALAAMIAKAIREATRE